MQNMQKEFNGHKIWLALTGGRDSRTSLAGLVRSGINFSTFTFGLKNLENGDRVVPKMLAERLGLEYRFIPMEESKYSKESERIYKENDAGMAVDGDMQAYCYHQFDALAESSKPIVVIKSSVYEDTIFYWRHMIDFGKPFTAEALREKFPNLACNEKHYNSLKQWFDVTQKNEKNIWMDIVNMFHWEQRSGCWLSSIMQSLDILDGVEFVQPANCRLILSLLMGYDAEERFKKIHQEYVVAKMCPQLKDIPYDNDIRKSKNRIIKKIAERAQNAFWLLYTYKSLASLRCFFKMATRK